MSTALALILFIIVVALAFDFLNGFHDAANSIATVVCTRVLTPTQAVVWASFFNFVAAFLFGTSVAHTVGSGLIQVSAVDQYVILSGLIGAICWNIITWLLGLPTSSSHALISGYAGAAIAKAGLGVIIVHGWAMVLLFIVLSPAIGFVLGLTNMVIVSWICRRASRYPTERFFRRMQLVSAGLYSIGHGANDAQKTMGIIYALLLSTAAADPNLGFLGSWAEGGMHLFGRHYSMALWIVLACQAAIALGTLFGGWRIVKTMGTSITKLQPVGGFCAETAGATALIGTALCGIPVSTTHAITGAILGVGSANNARSVRWIWGQRIVIAWVLTLPCSAVVSAVAYGMVSLIRAVLS